MDTVEIFKNCEYIFTDFDGTISTKDVINSFITSFSKGDWSIPERLWCEGKLSTKDCLKQQFDLITGLTKKDFVDFLYEIELDPYFVYFNEIMKSLNKKIVVLSDGYEIFIKSAFHKYGIQGVKIYSNQLYWRESNGYLSFEMEYPNCFKKCSINSGCCKCEVAKKYTDNFVYIGDGMSDRCIAKNAKLLFAKKGLEEFCKKENIPYIPFETYEDIIKVCKLN